MLKTARRIKCESGLPDGGIRLLADRVDARQLAEPGDKTVVNLARVITFQDSFYGEIKLTRKLFQQMIDNFDANVYGQDIFIDVAHAPSDGAAAEVVRLFLDGNKFRAEVAWTEFGIEAVQKRGFKYLSIDFTEQYVHPETEEKHGPVLFGAGLTIRPRVKGLDPVTLSSDADEQNPVAVSPNVRRILSEETKTMNKFLKMLSEALAKAKALSDDQKKQFTEQFEVVGKQLGDNETALQSLCDAMISTATQLDESIAAGSASSSIKLDFSGLQLPNNDGISLSDDDVSKIVAKQLAEAADAEKAAAKKLQEGLDANVKMFTDALEASDTIKSLSEDDRATILSEATDLITADMTAEQVTKLAEHQIKQADRVAVATQLSGMGYQVQGSTHIQMGNPQDSLALQEEINTRLSRTSLAANGALTLSKEVNPFVELVLGHFDAIHADRIAQENKMLAGGTTGIGDTSLPVGFQRTVIREALANLNLLPLINASTDFGAAVTTQIPYETRDVSGVLNDGIVYEGQGIHRASVTQAMDTAYIVARKLAFLISNEVMHFTRASAINWDAFGRNVESNARYMRELIHRAISNEIQRSSDAYLAANIADEDLDAQLTGSASTIKTLQFPIVRPHQNRDLQGNAVGSAENPITVTLNDVAISEYDGSGTQSVGTYYRVTNYNLGYVQFVNQAGTPVTPSSTVNADTISYSYATNIVKFDLDNGSTDLDLHLNGLLRSVGGRKAVLTSDRYVAANFALMSSTLNDTCTNARQFEAQSKKNGTDTDSMGDLAAVKGLPAFSSDVPGSDLGDERIILGARGTTSYTIAKPFVTGQPFEAVDASGNPTGQKQAYGEEYSAIKTPSPIRNRYTSVLAYSASGR